VIEVFVRIARLVGQPKSVGEIYGLLYISPEALPMDEISRRLNLSKGSTSQGLRLLKSLGAVQQHYQVGDRRDFYTAEISLKVLVSGYMEDSIEPLIEQGQKRIENLNRTLKQQAENDGEGPSPSDKKFYAGRIAKLSQWHKRARQFFPFIRRFLR